MPLLWQHMLECCINCHPCVFIGSQNRLGEISWHELSLILVYFVLCLYTALDRVIAALIYCMRGSKTSETSSAFRHLGIVFLERYLIPIITVARAIGGDVYRCQNLWIYITLKAR